MIDLAGGLAVHARGGARETYRPVQHIAGHPIVPGDALELAGAYRTLFGIDELYVADLDAITTGRPQRDGVAALARRAEVWLDAGITRAAEARVAIEDGAARAIVGLETLQSFDALAAIAAAIGTGRTAFSLDLRSGRPIATQQVLAATATTDAIAAAAAAAGAGAMIILDVARVGTGAGLDGELVRRVRATAPLVELLAGGGVRGLADVRQAAANGCDGVLIASALLDGRLTTADLTTARGLQANVSR